MTETKIQNLYDFGAGAGQAKSLVILLHGLGSNGRDLISLAPLWSAALPDTAFVSPDAPFACDMVPPGYPDSYQWFSLQNRDPHKILAGVETASPILREFIDAQMRRFNVPASKTALVGFSQGTMMSLYAAPRYDEALAGVLGYSGALFWPGETDIATLHKIPVCLIHGEADDVVPVLAYHDAKQVLSSAGFPVSGHTTPGLIHSIDQRGIEAGGEFLRSVLL